MSDDCCSIRLDCQTQELPLTIQFVHDTAYEVKLVQDAQTNIPPWSRLPQDLVIKPLKKDPDLEFTDQKETLVYKKLSNLQGGLIPRYYGVGDFFHEGKTVKAHVLERVNGTPLTDIDKAHWNELDIERKIKEAYTELSLQGVKHWDVQARHIFLVPGSESVRLIDFGVAKLCGRVDAEAQNTNDVEGLFRKLDE
jgi:predicted Ser/Thr protein kinase